MKLIREHINEKFIENFDPITDMGIGYVEAYIPVLCRYFDKQFHYSLQVFDFTAALNLERLAKLYNVTVKFVPPKKRRYKKGCIKITGAKHNVENFLNHTTNPVLSYKQIQKLINNKPSYINEKFTPESDPIKDMDIGIKAKLDKWIKEQAASKRWFETDDVNVQLRMATCEGKIEFVEYLLNNGAEVNADGGMPLVNAAFHGHYDIVELLIKYGANIDRALSIYQGMKISRGYDFLLSKAKDLSTTKNDKLQEKFTPESDPITDMGIGFAAIIQSAIKNIFKEDNKNMFIPSSLYYYSPGNIIEIKITHAPGRGQENKTGNYFVINFYSNDFYHPTKTFKSGNPLKISKLSYAKELIEKVGMTQYFYSAQLEYKTPWAVKFKIKTEYKKFFKPGTFSASDKF